MATMPGELMTRHRLTVDDSYQMAESGILGPKDRVELIAGEVLDAATRNTHRFRGPRPDGYTEQGMITPAEPLNCLALPGVATTLATALPLGPPEGA